MTHLFVRKAMATSEIIKQNKSEAGFVQRLIHTLFAPLTKQNDPSNVE